MVKDSKKYGKAKAKDFADFKKKYLKAAETVEKSGKSGIIKGKGIALQLFAEKTQHAEERSAERQVSDSAIDAALATPLHVGDVIVDEFGRKSVKYIGADVTVILNPDTGVVITSWRTGTKIRKKYEKRSD